MNVEAKAIKI